MSKTQPEIAKALLERRNRMTHVVLPGEITAEIGPDGVAEALKQRWLVPDVEEGFLCVSKDLNVIAEMRRIAEIKPEQYAPGQPPVAESHDLSLLHTRRTRKIEEVAAPMTGAPAPGLASTAQPQPPQAAPGVGHTDDLPPTTKVTVSRGGKTFNGVIEKLLPDGRFQVGFPADARPVGDHVFAKNEVSVIPTTPERPPGSVKATVGAAAS